MSERQRIANLERDVSRLEDALYAVAHRDRFVTYQKPRTPSLRTIWNRVQKRQLEKEERAKVTERKETL